MKDREKLKQRIADIIWEDRYDYSPMAAKSEETAEKILKVVEEER